MSGSGRQGPLHVWRTIQPLFPSATEEVFVARTFTVTITGRHLSNNAISTILPTDYINISLVYVTDWSYSYCLRIGPSVAVLA